MTGFPRSPIRDKDNGIINGGPFSDISEQSSCFQIGECLPQIFPAMGFQGDDRVQIICPQKGEQSGEVKVTPPRSQMLVAFTGIVMEMKLAQPG
jgi:hypothetical protein